MEVGSDPLLQPFLQAATAAESERHLLHLIESEAGPVIRRVLHRKLRPSDTYGRAFTSSDAANDFDDVMSGAREELIRQLALLRDGVKAEPIVNFRGYAGAVTYSVWAEHLRNAYPARSMLLNRLRYLLENRTSQRGFALWDGPSGERWCGFEKWRGGNPSGPTPKLQWLLVEPAVAAREAAGEADFKSMNPAKLLAELFAWLEQPIELRHLVDVMGELLEISDRKESLDAVSPAGTSPAETADPAPSPVDALKWHEYLRWLWSELIELSVPQRTAFLLHSDVAREFEICGIGSIRNMAAILELPAEAMARYWNEIPVEDFTIAKLLKRERQQVINLRRVARDRLAAAWEKWIK